MLHGRVPPQSGAPLGVAIGSLAGVLGYALGDEETFNERVKRLRERTGMSQIDFADAAGLSREGYQKIERGVSARPDNDSVVAIARAAKVPVSSLSRMLGWLPLDEAESGWMQTLTDDQRDLVLQLIEMLKTKAAHPPGHARPARSARS